MKAHNNGLHLHASSFSGPAMGIEENAARVTCEGGAQVKPEPLCAAGSGVLLYLEVTQLGALKKRVWPNEKWSSSLAGRNHGWYFDGPPAARRSASPQSESERGWGSRLRHPGSATAVRKEP